MVLDPSEVRPVGLAARQAYRHKRQSLFLVLVFRDRQCLLRRALVVEVRDVFSVILEEREGCNLGSLPA